MSITSDLFPQVLPFICLIFAIVAAFINSKVSWYFFIITLVLGFTFNAIEIKGLTAVLILLSLSFYAQKTLVLIRTKEGISPHNIKPYLKLYLKFIVICIVIIGCLALAGHLLPGFNNLQLLNEVTKNEQSIPFSLYLNFDKPLIIFVLLLLLPCVLQPRKPISLFGISSNFRLGVSVVIGFVFIFMLAMWLSLIDYAPTVPDWWWLFAFNNLLLTCAVEEVLFRGFIQHKLCQLMSPLVGLIITSMLFGVAHFSGGLGYIFVASIAGFIYGIVYLKTGRLWPAILTHFILNMIHLSLFTYPLSK